MYGFIGGFTGLITFIGSWIYCIDTYGFLFGLGLGWLPSFFLALIVGGFWPVGIPVLVLYLMSQPQL